MDNMRNGNLDKLAKAILASYSGDERTQRIGSAFLPSRDGIVAIIQQVRQVLFPGFFGELALTADNVKYHVGTLLVRLGRDLAEQIGHCLCYDQRRGQECPSGSKAASMAGEFLKQIPALRKMLALDAQAAYDGDPAAKSIEEVIYCYPGFHAISVYRMAHALLKLGVPLMPRIMTEHAHSVTGCDIHPGARIGGSFFIDHATGVVIGETTRIGRNVKIYQGVTLGALSFPKDERGRVIKGLQRHPTIGDNVTIYANATILGGDTTIGHGSTVAGNTLVTESVPPLTVVGQKPPELHLRSKKPHADKRKPAAPERLAKKPAGHPSEKPI